MVVELKDTPGSKGKEAKSFFDTCEISIAFKNSSSASVSARLL